MIADGGGLSRYKTIACFSRTDIPPTWCVLIINLWQPKLETEELLFILAFETSYRLARTDSIVLLCDLHHSISVQQFFNITSHFFAGLDVVVPLSNTTFSVVLTCQIVCQHIVIMFKEMTIKTSKRYGHSLSNFCSNIIVLGKWILMKILTLKY